MKRKPRFYFSFRSPFSWIASRLLEERLGPERRDSIEYIPYWEPDARTLATLKAMGGSFLYAQMSREKHLYILQDIKRLTQSLGLKHVWPIDQEPWWELPNLGYLAAAAAGKAPEFRAAAYRSRWEKGENIHELDTVRRIAEEVGVDPARVAAAPEDPEIRGQAAEALMRAYREGVFGIPFFICGFEKFWGVDRLEAFLAALDGARYEFFTRRTP